jgi:hypothetical protein
MKIESTDQDIRNVLSSGYYRIPRFQRPYSWTRENIQDFWDDVVKNLNGVAIDRLLEPSRTPAGSLAVWDLELEDLDIVLLKI